MNTGKPISTISYNTTQYLDYILNNLIDNDIIVFYAYIFHKAEENETKDHIHLYIEPNSRLDTSVLRKKFDEVDVTGESDKPLGVMPFRASKWQDWYLYSIHDIDYLRSKCFTREYIYSKENIIVSDVNYFNELVNTINYNYGLVGKIIEGVNQNIPFAYLIKSGAVKANNIVQAKLIYNELMNQKHIDYEENQKIYIPVKSIPKDIFDDV